MGTNYYLHPKPPCTACGRPHEALHIGKSSSGWCFSLHVMPEDGIASLDDWRRLWSQPEARILDEYGEPVTVDEMERKITERSHRLGGELRRHDLDGSHCIAHGPGTWDLIVGDFS